LLLSPAENEGDILDFVWDGETIPDSFDLRSVDCDGIADRCYVTPVKLQRPYGTHVLKITVGRSIPTLLSVMNKFETYTGQPIESAVFVLSQDAIQLKKDVNFTLEYDGDNVNCGLVSVRVVGTEPVPEEELPPVPLSHLSHQIPYTFPVRTPDIIIIRKNAVTIPGPVKNKYFRFGKMFKEAESLW